MAQKLNMQSPDLADEKFAQLAALFPNAVTETLDENGRPVRAIDKDILSQEIAVHVVEGREERYQFTWPDKREAIRMANTPSTQCLRPCREESVEFDTTQNLYIEGDNLEVLKLLRENYLGKVKMIYIDPPYNTGNDFVYNDDFAESVDSFKERDGQKDEQGNRLFKNTDSNGRFHTDWLNMMYPRLKVARDLLTEDGVIFISIDDNEMDNLRKICDEIFGATNFIGNLILKTATDNNPSQINIEHEYMICYAKNRILQSNWTRISESAQLIKEQYDLLKTECCSNEEIQARLRKWIKANKERLPQVAHYNNVDDKGVYSSSSNSSNPHPGGYMFDILHPTTQLPCPKPANGWRWPERTFWAYANKGDVEWGKDETTQPHIKKRIETSQDYLRTIIYEDNRATTKNLADLFDEKKVFDNPKPTLVLKRVIDYVTKFDSLVMDFFSGSATTAHAVMKLNAEDGGNRRFIMVQLPELTDEKSEAYKAGYKNICEIGKERIRRAGAAIRNEVVDLDTGFRVLKLDSSNMKDVYYTPQDFNAETLFKDNIKEDRSAEDLLFQVMLDLGVELSASIKNEELGKRNGAVFNVGDGYLMACFDEDIDEEIITEIAKKKPVYFVMRDSSAAGDSVIDNFEQIFKHYSPDTNCRII